MLLVKIKNIFNFLNRTDGTLGKKTIRSGFWVGISSIGINTLTFLRTIILARLLMPEVFGLMGICLIVIRGIQIFTETGFGAALIHRQKNFEEAKDTAFTIMILRGIVLALITFLIAPFVANYYEKTVLDTIIKIIAISFIFKGFRNINTIALQKELNFKRLAYLEQVTTVINFATVVTLAYFLRNVWALVIGQIVTSFVGTILSFIIIPGRPHFRFNKKIAKKLFGYGKFITGLSVVLFIATQIDNAFVGKILGMEYLGYYVVAYTLANLPATHISRMASKIMFPAYSKLQNDLPALRDVYLRVLKLVSSITIPVAAGIATLAPEIVQVLYGEKWLPAVGALQVLCVFGGFRAITSLNGYLFNGIGKPNIPFYFSTARLFAIILLVYPLTTKLGLVGASISVTVPMAAQFVAGMYILIRVIGLDVKKVVKILLITTFYSLIMSMTILYTKNNILVIDIYTLIFLIMVGIFTYAIMNFKDIFIYLRKWTTC